MSLPLIVTDLDGTLLDHHDYSFAAAESALRELKQRGIPVLINSSKTRREITALQEQLGINDPFICENGAAIYIQDQSRREVLFKQLATERQTVLRALHRLRIEYGYNFTGFADAPAAEIAELTGLTLEQAGWASERDYSGALSKLAIRRTARRRHRRTTHLWIWHGKVTYRHCAAQRIPTCHLPDGLY